jgi:hypothetical protein
MGLNNEAPVRQDLTYAHGCSASLGLDDPKHKTDAAVGDGAAGDGAMQSDSGGIDGGGGGDARAAPTCIFDNDATTFDNCNFAP